MNYQKLAAFGLLPTRILAAIAFIVHGLPKFSNVAGTEMFLENWDCRRTWQS
jgi:uncharacterized membrane protein YphA (DoxX/SURF4 family)